MAHNNSTGPQSCNTRRSASAWQRDGWSAQPCGQLLQSLGVDGVVRPLVTTLDLHESGVDELSHVMGEQRLRDTEQRDELALAHLLLATAQHIEDLNPQWLSQRLRRRRDALNVQRRVQAGGRSAALRRRGTYGKSRSL